MAPYRPAADVVKQNDKKKPIQLKRNATGDTNTRLNKTVTTRYTNISGSLEQQSCLSGYQTDWWNSSPAHWTF